MKLNKIWIKRYGPLNSDELEFSDGINLIHGPNESGKTLLVESLLKFLMGDGAVKNARVDECPKGFMEIHDGVENKFLEDGLTLIDYLKENSENFEYSVTPDQLRNIFVVRDGDLRIDDEDKFYERVTDKIVGIRSQDVRKIASALKDKGRLQPKTLKISGDSSYDDAKNELKKARELKEDIGSYLDEAKQEEVDELESKVFERKAERQDLEAKVEELEEAERIESYRKLVEAKEIVEENRKQVEELPSESDLNKLEGRLSQLDEGNRSELEDQKDRYSGLFKWSVGGAVATFALFLLTGFVLPALVVPLVAFGLAGYLFLQVRGISAKISGLDTEIRDIISDGQRIGIEANDTGSLRREIHEIKKRQRGLVGKMDESKGVLKNRLPIEAEEVGRIVEEAERALEEMKRDLDFEMEQEFSQSDLNEAQGRLEDLGEEISELEGRLEEHREKLREFSDEAHRIDFKSFTGEPLELEVKSLDALTDLTHRLDELVEKIETDAELSREAIAIFEDIEEAEDEKKNLLFREDSEVTDLFKKVTGGRYVNVEYDSENNELLAERPDGEKFTPSELSKGAKDQLYLCIRVALGKKLPDMDQGFFIMDDAFLASDSERLEKQAEFMENLSSDGWQIIYLTSKQDAIDALTPLLDGEPIQMEQLR